MLADVVLRTVGGVVVGVAFYYLMSSSIPKESNCSFSAGISTDIAAFIAGAYLAHQGYALGHGEIYSIGIAIIVEHIMQAAQHKLPRYL